MDENVMRVLQMLQEGKISAQEAETLIAALRGEAPGAHEAEKPTVESNTEEKEDKSLFDSLPFNKVNKVNEQIKDKIKEVKAPRIDFDSLGERISKAVARVQPEKIVKRVQTELRKASKAGAHWSSSVSNRVRTWSDGEDARPTNAMDLPQHSETVDQEFHLEPGAKIFVDNPLGNIKVTGIAEGTASVTVTKLAWNPSEEDVKSTSALMEVNMHGTDARLDIKVSAPDGFRDGTVDMELRVPRNASNVRVNTHFGTVELTELDGLAEGVTTSGALHLHDLGGDARGETANGDLKLEHIAGAGTVATQSGDITADDVRRGLIANTASGDVKATGIEGGRVECKSVSGDATLERAGQQEPLEIIVESVSGNATLLDATGSIAIKAVSGDVKAENLSATRLQAQTVSGDVTLKLKDAFSDTMQVNTVSGDVSIALTEGSNVRLSLSTTSGDLKCEWEAQDVHASETLWTGQIGTGSGTLNVQTISGDAKILKA
jgi:DUF4097 and DUF4098 domain-containing protein YvlB